MKTWTFPALVGIAFILGGWLIFVKPEIVAYIIATGLVLIGIVMLYIAFTMWKESRELQQILQEIEAREAAFLQQDTESDSSNPA